VSFEVKQEEDHTREDSPPPVTRFTEDPVVRM